MSIINYCRALLGQTAFLKKVLAPINSLLYRINFLSMNRKFKRYGLEVFARFVDTLNEINIQFWPEFGTLLGIYRENDFIKHDFDFDFGAYVDDRDIIIQMLVGNGFKLKHSYFCPEIPYVKEDSFTYKGVSVDVFYFHNDEQSAMTHVFVRNSIDNIHRVVYRIKVFKFTPVVLKPINFKGMTINVPSDTSEHLIVSYGESFMIPDPGFKSINFNYLDGYYAYSKEY